MNDKNIDSQSESFLLKELEHLVTDVQNCIIYLEYTNIVIFIIIVLCKTGLNSVTLRMANFKCILCIFKIQNTVFVFKYIFPHSILYLYLNTSFPHSI